MEHRRVAEPTVPGGSVQQLLGEQPARVSHCAQLPGGWQPVALEELAGLPARPPPLPSPLPGQGGGARAHSETYTCTSHLRERPSLRAAPEAARPPLPGRRTLSPAEVSAPAAGLPDEEGQQASRLPSGADGAERDSAGASPRPFSSPRSCPYRRRLAGSSVFLSSVSLSACSQRAPVHSPAESARADEPPGCRGLSPCPSVCLPLGLCAGPLATVALFLGTWSRHLSRSGTWGGTPLGEDGGHRLGRLPGARGHAAPPEQQEAGDGISQEFGLEEGKKLCEICALVRNLIETSLFSPLTL